MKKNFTEEQKFLVEKLNAVKSLIDIHIKDIKNSEPDEDLANYHIIMHTLGYTAGAGADMLLERDEINSEIQEMVELNMKHLIKQGSKLFDLHSY